MKGEGKVFRKILRLLEADQKGAQNKISRDLFGGLKGNSYLCNVKGNDFLPLK